MTIRSIFTRIVNAVRGVPNNDNVHIPKPDGRRSKSKAAPLSSTAGVYVNKTSGRPLVVINLAPQDAAAHGIVVGQSVKVTATGNGFAIRPADKGAVVTSVGKRLRIQAGGMRLAPMPATTVRLSRGSNGEVLVTFGGKPPGGRLPANDNGSEPEEGASPSVLPVSYLDDFVSLSGPGMVGRRKFLAANDNDREAMIVTAAGDECYTPRFLINTILAAARRSAFDADFCSMRKDGRYDLALPSGLAAKMAKKHPRRPGSTLPVIGHVPAQRYYTKDDTPFGSLLLEWRCEFGWCNPPYSLRSWTVFLEKAAKEVAAGRAGILVCLVPMDTFGPHIRHLFDKNAYRIELSRNVPFFMRRKTKKDKKTGKAVVVENVVEPIKGNSLVVFGKGVETRKFLLRLVDGLEDIDYVTAEQARHYREQFTVAPRLANAA